MNEVELQTSGRRRTGRPPRISRADILSAARRIVDNEGLDRLTMRRLADDVGSTPMALYHHIGDKDTLLVLMLEDFATTLPRPRLPKDPRQRIVAIFVAIHDGFSSCPWIIQALTSDAFLPSEGAWYVENIIDAAIATGLTPPEAVHAYRTVWYYTVGELLAGHAAAARRTRSDRPTHRTKALDQLSPQQFPRLAALAPHWADLTAQDTYRDGLLTIVIALLPPHEPPPTPDHHTS